MSLGWFDIVIRLAEIQPKRREMNSKKEDDIPTSSPQKAPAELVRFQNMPRSMVANSGALTQLKMAWM